MKNNVKITKLGRVYVDDKCMCLAKLVGMCNVGTHKLNKAISSKDEQRIFEWLLKSENNVHASARTYWRDGTPMWASKVAIEVGLSVSTASARLKNWVNDGDTDKLLRPKMLCDLESVNPIINNKTKVRRSRKKQADKSIECIKSSRDLIKNKIDSSDGDLSFLSGKSKRGNLNKIKGPSKYELENL